jgi:hypothetical protein
VGEQRVPPHPKHIESYDRSCCISVQAEPWHVPASCHRVLTLINPLPGRTCLSRLWWGTPARVEQMTWAPLMTSCSHTQQQGLGAVGAGVWVSHLVQ